MRFKDDGRSYLAGILDADQSRFASKHTVITVSSPVFSEKTVRNNDARRGFVVTGKPTPGECEIPKRSKMIEFRIEWDADIQRMCVVGQPHMSFKKAGYLIMSDNLNMVAMWHAKSKHVPKRVS